MRKTPEEWSVIKGIRILDPDGWRFRSGPDWSDPIDEEEFDERAAMSTTGPWDWTRPAHRTNPAAEEAS